MEPRRIQPVRVLFLDHVPRLSGAEQSLADLVVGLAQGPVEPVVVLPEDGPLAHQLRAHGILVRMVPMSKRMLETSRESLAAKPLLAFVRVFGFLAASWRLYRLIRETQPRIVHTNTLKTHLLALLPCKAAGVPLVWHLRDILPGGWLRRAVVALGRFTDAIIVPSRAVAEPFKGQRHLLRKIRLVPNGIRVSDFQDARADRSLREMMGAGRSDLVVGLVARIAPWKGQEVFLRAAAMLAARHPRAIFAVIGAPLFAQDEEYERALQRMTYDLGIDDRVVFCGWQPAPEAMAACDVIVHASQKPEPFGRTIVEAMAAGKPVVAAEGGAVREILPPACGLIVPASRPEMLADALDRILSDRKILKRMGESSAAIADSYFPVQRTIQSVAQVYRALIGKARKRPERKRVRTKRRSTRAKLPAMPQAPMSWPRAEAPAPDEPPVGPAPSRPAVHPGRPARRRRPAARSEAPTRPERPSAEQPPATSTERARIDLPDRDGSEPVAPREDGPPPVARKSPEPPAPEPTPAAPRSAVESTPSSAVEAAPRSSVEAPPRPKRVAPLRRSKPRARVRLDVLDEPRTVRPVAVAPTGAATAAAAPARAPETTPIARPTLTPVPTPAPATAPSDAPFRFERNPLYDALKRAVDIVISLAVLVLGAPLWVCIAIAIKLESPGPVLHRGTVHGLGCRPFTYFKFRSMRIDGDDRAHRRFIERYVRENGGHEHNGEMVFKLLGDDRVTAVGRFIRKLSLDEVPQLFNVLRGDMSIVGPRPPLDYEFEHYDEVAKRRLLVRPGITGMQQVWHRHSASFDEKLKLDMKYIENRSLWLDIKLILHTPAAALRGH